MTEVPGVCTYKTLLTQLKTHVRLGGGAIIIEQLCENSDYKKKDVDIEPYDKGECSLSKTTIDHLEAVHIIAPATKPDEVTGRRNQVYVTSQLDVVSATTKLRHHFPRN